MRRLLEEAREHGGLGEVLGPQDLHGDAAPRPRPGRPRRPRPCPPSPRRCTRRHRRDRTAPVSERESGSAVAMADRHPIGDRRQPAPCASCRPQPAAARRSASRPRPRPARGAGRPRRRSACGRPRGRRRGARGSRDPAGTLPPTKRSKSATSSARSPAAVADGAARRRPQPRRRARRPRGRACSRGNAAASAKRSGLRADGLRALRDRPRRRPRPRPRSNASRTSGCSGPSAPTRLPSTSIHAAPRGCRCFGRSSAGARGRRRASRRSKRCDHRLGDPLGVPDVDALRPGEPRRRVARRGAPRTRCARRRRGAPSRRCSARDGQRGRARPR